jgi:hypothetical protein
MYVERITLKKEEIKKEEVKSNDVVLFLQTILLMK